MVKRNANRGFTLSEILIVLMLTVGLAGSLHLIHFKFTHVESLNSKVIECQLRAWSQRTFCVLSDDLWFNMNGNINHAQTVDLEGFHCVFQLGFGRFFCE